MTQNRSLLVHGLGLTLRRLPALLWAFAFSFLYAAINTARISGAIGNVTDASLAAQPLHHGFDLGTVGNLVLKLNEGPGIALSAQASILLYLATYFILVPGTLLCYQTGTRARLSTLLQAGVLHFWRFVRITLLAAITFGLILGPLVALWSKAADLIDARITGRTAFLYELSGYLVIALIAALLRLYFDQVEVYTVQLGLHLRPSGKPDRRVRKTLIPALRALRTNFGRAYLTFLLLSVLGLAAVFLTARIAMHSLAQPRVWPIFLVLQAGLFLMLFTRFWQRGAESTLALNLPIIERPVIHSTFAPRESFTPVAPLAVAAAPVPTPAAAPVFADPIPPAEPAVPSLSEPDPAVYHHEVSLTRPKPEDDDLPI